MYKCTCNINIGDETLKVLVPKDEDLCVNYPVPASGLDPIKSKDGNIHI
jgi:hypothetical protein